jgi:hypothetical protein
MSTLTENIIVNSSAIHNAVYQHVTNELSITFKSGLTYEYYNVPSHIFERLRTSRSKGKFINAHVLRRYNFKKIV